MWSKCLFLTWCSVSWSLDGSRLTSNPGWERMGWQSSSWAHGQTLDHTCAVTVSTKRDTVIHMVILKQMRNHCNEKHNSCLQINKTETKLACDSTEIKKIDEKNTFKWSRNVGGVNGIWLLSLVWFDDVFPWHETLHGKYTILIL